jgi:hypothetical protein
MLSRGLSYHQTHRTCVLVADSLRDASTMRSISAASLVAPTPYRSYAASKSNRLYYGKHANRVCIKQHRAFSMSDTSIEESYKSRGRKVWKAQGDQIFHSDIEDGPSGITVSPSVWNKAMDDDDNRWMVHESLARICEQVRE